jgi:hypothetical protein
MKHARAIEPTRSWRTHCPGPWALGLALAAIVGCYLVIWLYLDPPARYYASAPVFFFDHDFFRSHLRPGGLLEYGCGFLAQLDHEAWLGALGFTAILATLSLSARAILERTVGVAGLVWTWPGLVLLTLYGQYSPPVWEIAGGLLVTAVALLGWLTWKRLSGWRRLAVFLGLTAILYYLAGAWVCLLFIGGVGASEWIGRVPALKALTHNTNPRPRQRPPKTNWTPALWWQFWTRGVQVALGVLALILMAWSFDHERRALWRIQSEAERGDWGGVITAAAGLREYPVQARLQVNRALHHLGRLTGELFCHPQRSGLDLLASLADGLIACTPLSDTLLELGQVNLAEHYAHEALELRGERPELLWRLARINLVKERPEAARIFLNRLHRAPFHRGRADAWLEAIEHDRTMAGQPEIVHLRSLRPTQDWVERVFPTEPMLRQLLEANRRNRMATDYLMAHFLLTRQPEALLQNLGRLDDTAVSGLPRHLAEAILIQVRPGQEMDLHARTIDPEIAHQFERFRRAAPRPGEAQMPQPALDRDYGDTYWYYAWFGQTHGRANRPPPQDRR